MQVLRGDGGSGSGARVGGRDGNVQGVHVRGTRDGECSRCACCPWVVENEKGRGTICGPQMTMATAMNAIQTRHYVEGERQ